MCFWKKSINSFEFDPAYYLSTPGYKGDVMLKFIDVNLKLISDIGKCQFIESSIRGGISMTCKNYAEANNKFWKSYDGNKCTSCVIYLDDNNLYGHSMLQLFPTEILGWVNPKDFNLDNYSSNSPIGCFLQIKENNNSSFD